MATEREGAGETSHPSEPRAAALLTLSTCPIFSALSGSIHVIHLKLKDRDFQDVYWCTVLTQPGTVTLSKAKPNLLSTGAVPQ